MLLAKSLDDCYASGEIATWVAFNFESIDEHLLDSIRVLDLNSKPGDNIRLQLQASKLFFAANDAERLGGINMIRHLCEPEWHSILKEHEIKHRCQVTYADFAHIMG